MLQQRFYLILQSSQPVFEVPAFWQMFYYTIHSEKIKAFAFKWLDGKKSKNTAFVLARERSLTLQTSA